MATQNASKSKNKKLKDKKVTFKWEGRDRKGNPSKGKVDAENLSQAKTLLRKQGINPKKVTKERSFAMGNKNKPIKPLDIAYFTRQMATMMKSGVPLIQGLEIVANSSEKTKLKEMIYDIRNEVNSGKEFSRALTQHPKYFDDLTCSLVNAGEQSGALENMLDRIATYKEKMEKLKAKIKKAMTYPAAVILVGLLVSTIMLVKVIPSFQDVFKSFGADLPAFTLMVIAMSEWMQKYWFIMLLAFASGGWFFSYLRRTNQKVSDSVDRAMLKLPIIGRILFKSSIARFARTLSTTFAAGVPLVNALDSAAGASGNVVFRTAIYQIRNGVASGQSLEHALAFTGIFPSDVAQMIAIGEEAGSLDHMLDKVASFYEDEVDNIVDNLSSLLEPLIMVVLGGIVGSLIIAMYLPIFQLGQAVMG